MSGHIRFSVKVRDLMLLCVALGVGTATSAFGADYAVKVTAPDVDMGAPLRRETASQMPPRQTEVVIVWGFRLRTTQHPSRNPAIVSGYSELVEKADCQTKQCGFVITQQDGKWRASNVIAASEAELMTMQRNLEKEGTTLVVVNPTGTKRTVPSF